jgi:hypothetical protein
MSGLAYRVPANFPGNIRDVKWTGDIGIAKGVSFSWRWSAAVYSSFAAHAGLHIKPIDSKKDNPYPNSNEEGTPENFTRYVIAGATGKGKHDYTGDHSSRKKIYCKTKNDKGEDDDDDDDDDDDKDDRDDDDDDDEDDDDRPGAGLPRSLTRQLPSFLADPFSKDNINIQASPNPSNDHFNLRIDTKNSNPITITISDVFGNILEKRERVATNSNIRVGSNFKTGVYFVTVTQGDQRKTIMVIKAK